MMLANYLVKRLLPRSGLTIAEDAATARLTEWHGAESTTKEMKTCLATLCHYAFRFSCLCIDKLQDSCSSKFFFSRPFFMEFSDSLD